MNILLTRSALHHPVASRPHPRRLFKTALAGIPVLAALACLCVGCDSSSRVITVDKTDFGSVVLASDQPVLVDFYKEGCPVCAPLDPAFDQLSKEFDGRAKIVRFEIMTAYWTFPAPELKEKYEIFFVPTVILFDKGVEVQRWNVVYAAQPYRKALDKLLASPTAAPNTK